MEAVPGAAPESLPEALDWAFVPPDHGSWARKNDKKGTTGR